jgi:hypothetical protein
VVKLSTLWRRVTIGVVVFLFVVALLCWAGAGQTTAFNIVNLLQGTLSQSIPIMLGALTGVICSRSGVVNIGIEGQLLLGAFVAAMVASASGSLWLGLIAGAAAGCVVGALLAVFAIQYTVDQIILGVVLNSPHHRPHRVPVRRPDGALRQHAELPADLQRDQDPAAGRHPDHRAGVLPGDDLPLPDLPGPGPGPGGPVQPPGGGCAPARSASTRSRRTPSASGCTPPGTATSSARACWPASAAPT